MPRLTEVYSLVAEIAAKRGVTNINQSPGLWRFKVGEFDLALNGHDETIEDLLPFELLVCAGGLPLGIVGPFDGWLMMSAEDDLIAAMKAELGKESP